MSIHDYTGLTYEQIEAREAYLLRHPNVGLTPSQIAARNEHYRAHPEVIPPGFPLSELYGEAASPDFPPAAEATGESAPRVETSAETPDHTSPISTISGEKKSGRDAKSGRFAKGWSGRPKGALNKSTLLLRALEGESEHLFHHLVAANISGDSLALRVAVTRLLPARRDLPVDVDLPVLVTTDEVIAAMAHVVALVGDGVLTPSEGMKVSAMLQGLRRALHAKEQAA